MKIRMCEIVSQVDSGDTIFDIEKAKLILVSKKCIKDWCYILHDKDTYTQEDELKDSEHREGMLKPKHIHIALRFNQPQDSKYVAKWFGISENFVNKIHGKYVDAVLYQTHRNCPDKYQYSEKEVIANFNYNELIKDEMTSRGNINAIIQGILNGEITEYNKLEKVDGLLLVKYARQINDAFKLWQQKVESSQQERDMKVIFITGKSGSGKTTLAKRIAESKKVPYFVSSGSNDILYGYVGQKVVILDDFRPSSLGLADLLKLTDPFTASSVKSRYKNKFLNADILILTTVLSLDTFYEHVFSEEKEPIIQLKRRCSTYIRMDRENIYVSVWDNNKMRYSNEKIYKNDLLDEFKEQEKEHPVDVQARVDALMPFLKKDDSVFRLVPLERGEKK